MTLPNSKHADMKQARKCKKRDDYKRLVLEAWDHFDREDRREIKEHKAAIEQKAKERL